MVEYELTDGVATISLDDGKVNALSLDMLTQIGAALDRAEADGAVVVLVGREGIFSGGFDLKVLNAGGSDAKAMLAGGFRLAERMLGFPTPIVVACTGHAIAMGLFLVQAADYRVGADGPFRLTANEVAIGLTLPVTAVELLRLRCTPAHLQRAANLAEVFSPTDAGTAGLLDVLAPVDEVRSAADIAARGFLALDMRAHVGTKRRLRADTIAAIHAANEADFGPAQ